MAYGAILLTLTIEGGREEGREVRERESVADVHGNDTADADTDVSVNTYAEEILIFPIGCGSLSPVGRSYGNDARADKLPTAADFVGSPPNVMCAYSALPPP